MFSRNTIRRNKTILKPFIDRDVKSQVLIDITLVKHLMFSPMLRIATTHSNTIIMRPNGCTTMALALLVPSVQNLGLSKNCNAEFENLFLIEGHTEKIIFGHLYMYLLICIINKKSQKPSSFPNILRNTKKWCKDFQVGCPCTVLEVKKEART